MPYNTDIIVSGNHININNSIEKILIDNLISGFDLISMSQDLWDCENFSNMCYEDYMRDFVIQDLFNDEELADISIFEYYKIGYTMDYKIFLHMCKCVKEEYDNYDNGEMFAEMFYMDTDTEQQIINNYALFYITEKIVYNRLEHTIIKIHRNIFKFEANKKKHNKLINLYNKLDKLNKKKIIINKILNDKFDTDILQNIIQFYK